MFALDKCRVGSAKKTDMPASIASPLTSKTMKNGISATNSPAQLPMLEKAGNGTLKPTSLAKKLQASENDDPNSPDIAPCKTAKPALARQRSQKVHEEKPTLIRQRSQKFVDAKPTVASHPVRGDSSDSNSESDQGKGTPQKKAPVVSVGGVGAVKALKDHSSKCITPVKELVSSHPEVKKPAEVTGSPFSGHHCKSSRCAANDPNFTSPAPTKKYLVAKKGTPGSIRKATPGVEKCNEDASSESSDANDCVVPKVKGRGQVALEEAFNKMALEQSAVEEQQVTKQVTVSQMCEDLKEVSLEEDKEPLESLSAENIREWSRNSVYCGEKGASISQGMSMNVESGAHRDSMPTGVDLFLQVASDCLENIDLNKLDVPPTKVAGKKR